MGQIKWNKVSSCALLHVPLTSPSNGMLVHCRVPEGCFSSTYLGVCRWVECNKGKYNHKHEIKVKEKGIIQESPHGQSSTRFLLLEVP